MELYNLAVHNKIYYADYSSTVNEGKRDLASFDNASRRDGKGQVYLHIFCDSTQAGRDWYTYWVNYTSPKKTKAEYKEKYFEWVDSFKIDRELEKAVGIKVK